MLKILISLCISDWIYYSVFIFWCLEVKKAKTFPKEHWYSKILFSA